MAAAKKVALVQSWVPTEIKRWVASRARKRGLSVAAWLRTHLIELKAKSR